MFSSESSPLIGIKIALISETPRGHRRTEMKQIKYYSYVKFDIVLIQIPLCCELGLFQELPEFPDAFHVPLMAAGAHRQCQDPLCSVQVCGAVSHVTENKFELCHLLE